VRTTVTQWHAETLRTADYDVSVPFAGRFQHGQAEQVGCDCYQRFLFVHLFNQFSVVVNFTGRTGVLQQNATQLRIVCGLQGVADDTVDAHGFGAITHNFDSLWVAGVGNVKHIALAFRQAVAHGHGFGCSRSLVEHRGICQFHPGQVADHGLKIQKCFQTPL